MELKDSKFLIIEDEEENRNTFLRLLINDFNIPDENIEEASNLKEAKNLVDEFEPNIVLLDLKIPAKEDQEPDIGNSYEFIEKAELYNERQLEDIDKIKIIIISGSVEDDGVRKFIKSNDILIDFFDKAEIAINFDRFKTSFERKLKQAVIYKFLVPKIDYSFVRKSILKDLGRINAELRDKMNDQLLTQFEKLNDRGVNEYSVSNGIIIKCGEIVEDIIHSFSDTVYYGKRENTIIKKLTVLSGRNFIGWDNESSHDAKYESLGNEYIRRISQQYAHFAYQLSSQARHSKLGDDHNNKWFAGHNAGFTKEDAANSINLIIPLIKDYIEYMKNK